MSVSTVVPLPGKGLTGAIDSTAGRISGPPHHSLRLPGEPGFGWIARTLPRELGAAVNFDLHLYFLS